MPFSLQGGGGSDSESEGETTSESGIETAVNEADQAIADASVFQLSDFPTGWREVEDDDPNEGADNCFKPDYEGTTLTGRAESDNYERGETTSATSGAAVLASTEDAEAVFEQMSDGSLAECIAEFLEDPPDLPSDVSVTRVQTARLALPALGDESDARQVVAEFESEGLSPSAYVDLVIVRSGRAISAMLFFDVLSAFDSAEEVRLAKVVVQRMEEGQ